MKKYLAIGLLFMGFATLESCKNLTEDVVVPNNQIPWYEDIPTVVIENYVTRIYIDLLGRDPLDEELLEHVDDLIANNLDTVARSRIVDQLMYDSTFRENEISYKHQYYQRFYDINKARFLENASEAEINKEVAQLQGGITRDSLTGDSVGMQIKKAALQRFIDLMDSKDNLRTGAISYRDMMRFMINNGVYDIINMNTFNFINASFNDLFFRFPTSYEYSLAFEAIEKNNSVVLFNEVVANKLDYLNVVTTNRSFHEGMVNWIYQSLLARMPRSDELFNWTNFLQEDGDLKLVQKNILISDEYAYFRTLN